MYTSINFKSKKALKDAVAAGQKITIFNPGPFGDAPRNGTASVEGPHYPEPHKWYGQVEVKDGYVIRVK